MGYQGAARLEITIAATTNNHSIRNRAIGISKILSTRFMLTRTQGIWLAFPGNGSRHSINAKSTGDAGRDLYALARNLATPKVRRDYPEAKRNNIQL